jgi:hypothetical protein
VVSQHRGLVITLVVAVVVAAIGIGVVASATNDTDESVHDDVSAPFLSGGRSLEAGTEAGDVSRGSIRVPVTSNVPRLELQERSSACADVEQLRSSNNSIALVFTPQPECRRGSVRYTATVSGARTKDGSLQAVATLDLRGDGANGFPDAQRSSCTPLDVPGGVITRCSYASGQVSVAVYY